MANKLTIFQGRDLGVLTEPRPRNSTGIHAEFIDRERLKVSDREAKSHSTEQNFFATVTFLM